MVGLNGGVWPQAGGKGTQRDLANRERPTTLCLSSRS